MSSLDSQPLHNFIETYDTPQVWKDNICESIISFFEKKYIPKSSGLKAFNRNRQKVCSTITFNFGEDWEINDSVYFFVKEGIDKYRDKYEYLNSIDKFSQWRLCPSYNIQRYDGKEEGYFSLHNETSGSYPYRLLAWMVYLNDADCGTEFPYQNITITPKKGRTVIWPAAWTHPHRGVTPNVGVKYIATGWFYHLPKGEPKFDGRHPDEKRIQEIVV